ncbi:MAG TPA: glycine oxidase ThiO [Steroidobacteraceae bacterium]|jgi:glycine oxidase|nr:glycine oxidase ThiO [Steroidobacteraceae bacterium]
MQAIVLGAGVAGLCCALELATRGVTVQLLERADESLSACCSWRAGGMLAPWCELEAAGEPLIAQLGLEGLAWWQARADMPGLHQAGTLVVAAAREQADLRHFAQRTREYRWLHEAQIGELEPELAGRFADGVFFADEGHLDPRRALRYLLEQLSVHGVQVRFAVSAEELERVRRGAGVQGHVLIDCRGLAAADTLPCLRGVRGEMLLLQSQELALRRPVRLLHPRLPLYVVPRGDGLYMVGATSLESDDAGPVTVRSALELLSAAYALHPAFGEARIVEMSSGVRPAFEDNLPRILHLGRVWYVNGLYRHGFLIAPTLARRLAAIVLDGQSFPELQGLRDQRGPRDENPAERRLA